MVMVESRIVVGQHCVSCRSCSDSKMRWKWKRGTADVIVVGARMGERAGGVPVTRERDVSAGGPIFHFLRIGGKRDARLASYR